MKYFKTITILFAFVSVNASTVYVVDQDNPKREASIAPTIHSYDERVYQYEIGERLKTSLLEKCFLSFGTITYIKGDRISFTIERSFPAHSPGDGVIELLYTKPRSSASFNSEARSAWDFVDVVEGRRLFVSQCQGNNGLKSYKTVVSNEAYFGSIEFVIEFDTLLQQNPDRLTEIPQIMDSQSDLIFAGYAIALFRMGNAISSPENRAVVLGRILESSKVPPGLWFVRAFLKQLLVREGEDAIAPETRDFIVKRLVDYASRKDVKADQVFALFLDLAQGNKLDISRFLDKKNRANFEANYRVFIRNNESLTGRAAFDRLLKNGKRDR